MSPLEASGTLILAYAMKRGVDEGVLDTKYERRARRALEACDGVVGDAGAVSGVSKPPASALSPLGVTPYGQGWFLLAASCFA